MAFSSATSLRHIIEAVLTAQEAVPKGVEVLALPERDRVAAPVAVGEPFAEQGRRVHRLVCVADEVEQPAVGQGLRLRSGVRCEGVDADLKRLGDVPLTGSVELLVSRSSRFGFDLERNHRERRRS